MSGKKQGKDNHQGIPASPQQQRQQQIMAPPAFMPPPQMQFPIAPPGGYAPFPPGAPVDPNQQQQLLQIQIRQQQLQLQQMQQQQQAAAAAQQRVTPPKHHSNPLPTQQQQQQQQQQSFASFTTTTTPHINANKPSQASSPSITKKRKSLSPLPKKPAPKPPSSDQVRQWLAQCDWKDKTIYVSRQLMGGSSINGFAKATSAAQRLKKQRGRQIASVNKKRASESQPPPVQTPIEIQRDIMNPRTAKKIKQEFQQGAAFCKSFYEIIQGIMRELDPASVLPPIERLTSAVPKVAVPKTKTTIKTTTTYTNKTKIKTTTPPPARAVVPATLQGSGLRKQRKRKLAIPPLEINLSEYDVAGKRIFTKKEHNLRIAELLRFRTLRAGDYVAAKTSSRDLWILARVISNYPAVNMDANEFLKLTPVRI
jgi:hypothetical protein